MKALLRAAGVVVGLGLFLLGGLVIYLSVTGQTSASNRLADLLYLFVALAGLWLVHASVPGVMGRFLLELPGAGRGLLAALLSPRALLNPILLALWILVGIAAASLVWPHEAWFAGVIGFCVFTLAAPLAIAWQDFWWARMLLTAWLGAVMFIATALVPEAISGRKVGEGAMLYMAPVMWFPAALALSGIVHYVTRRRRAAT